MRLAIVTCLLLHASSVAAQQHYGRWSWDATLGGTQRGHRGFTERREIGRVDEKELRLALNLNGFVLHPALATLRVGVDAGLSRTSALLLNTRRWGLNANAGVLPLGAYPLTLYAQRSLYDHSLSLEEDPLRLLGLPDTSTNVGGRWWLKAGRLRGTLLGYDRGRLDYLSESSKSSRRSTAFVDWSRRGPRFQRHLRLDRRREELGPLDFSSNELSGAYEQRGNLTPAWRWETSAAGIHRELGSRTATASFDTLRTTQSFVRPLRQKDTLDLRYEGGLTSAGAVFQSHSAMGRYHWRGKPPWTVSPFAGFGLQALAGARVYAPQLGLAASWTGRARGLDLTANHALSYAPFLGAGSGPQRSESALSLDLGVFAGHGSALRQELDVSLSHNRLRSAGDALVNLPDLGASLIGTGTEDVLRGRLTLRWHWRAASLHAYSEGSWLQASGTVAARRPGYETLTHTIQLTNSRMSLTGNSGQSRTKGPSPQRLDFISGHLALHLLRSLQVTFAYRGDTRELRLAPDLESTRYEAGANLRLGAFFVDGRLFRSTDRSIGGVERRNDGFIVSFSRRLAGWLPFLTGVNTAGDIR